MAGFEARVASFIHLPIHSFIHDVGMSVLGQAPFRTWAGVRGGSHRGALALNQTGFDESLGSVGKKIGSNRRESEVDSVRQNLPRHSCWIK